MTNFFEQVKDFAMRWIPKAYWVSVADRQFYMDGYLHISEGSTLDISVMRFYPLNEISVKLEYKDRNSMMLDAHNWFNKFLDQVEGEILMSDLCEEYIRYKIEAKIYESTRDFERWFNIRLEMFRSYIQATHPTPFLDAYMKGLENMTLPSLAILDLIPGNDEEEEDFVFTDMDLDYSFQLNSNKALLTHHERCPICHYPTNGEGHRCILTTEQL